MLNQLQNCGTKTSLLNRVPESASLTAETENHKFCQKNYRDDLTYRILTDNERAVLDALVENNKPQSGKELSNICDIDESTIRTHIIPSLKKKNYPIKNRKTVGYYLDWDNYAQ
jgi:biotin operon repressor